MKRRLHTTLTCIAAAMLTTTTMAQPDRETKPSPGGYIKASVGFGQRIAGISESATQFPGLEDLAKQQRSGFVFKAEGGLFINSEQSESIGLLYQRFGSKANGPVSAPGLSSAIDFNIDEKISLVALVFNEHLKFSKTSKSGATFSVGAGYNHYNGNVTSIASATNEKLSKGGLGYLLGAEIDLAVSKSFFITTGVTFSAGTVRLAEGEDGKENLSMIIGGLGVKFVL